MGPDYNVGGKLFVATLVALLLGYLWACIDGDRNPLDPLKLLMAAESPPTDRPVVREKPAPRPRAPASLTGGEMAARFASIDESLRRGRIPEAREKAGAIDKLLVPDGSLARLREYERRVDRYNALLQETSRGGLVVAPRLWNLSRRGGGGQVVRLLSRERDLVCFETLAGARSSLGEPEVESLRPLDETSARAAVRDELLRQAAARDIAVSGGPDSPLSYGEKNAAGLKFFELADFCARNGLNEEIVPLFDEGLRRDADLLGTVREDKAGRLVSAWRYFLLINATDDARRTDDILRERYADTRAFRERGVIEIPPPPRTPGDLRKDRAGELIALGNRYYDEAMGHLLRADPNTNPEGWAEGFRKARELFLKANSEGYIPAQETFGSGRIPQYLLDRIRDTQMRAKLCGNLSVSK